jgi:hypothetical protein
MLVLGAWVGISVAMFVVAIHNFRQVESVLESRVPAVTAMIKQMTPPVARTLLRHQANELNRHYFDIYGLGQIALGLVLAGVLLFATNGRSWMMAITAALVIMALFQRFFLFPEIEYLGQLLEFGNPGNTSSARQRFDSFHSAFGIAEAIKGLLMVVLGGRLLYGGSDRRRRHQVRDTAIEAEA